MKGPVKITQVGVGQSNPIPLDPTLAAFNVGLQTTIAGAPTYKVEYTLDDIRAAGYNSATGNWTAVPNFSALTAAAGGLLDIPCTAIRLNVTVAGTVNLSILQSGRVD